MNLSTSNDDNLETFSLIWLDADVNSKLNQEIQQKLRAVINHLRRFENKDECQKYIEQRTNNDRLVLIVSGRFGRELVPEIHKYRHIVSIYVFCFDKPGNEKWAKDYTKIKAVIIADNELISRITEDAEVFMKADEPLLMNISSKVNDQFLNFQFLIDCLLRMNSKEMVENELINICEKEYQNNEDQLRIVHEFQHDYSSDKALWWYIRESFFYQIINKALNTENLHIIYIFRPFLTDIHRLLEKNQSTSPVRVYRNNLMSNDELENLKQSIGQLICMKSFMFTSTDRSKVLAYLNKSDNKSDLQRVLFEIDADPKMVNKRNPFADISSQNDSVKGFEVMFMLGSVFRLNEIKNDEDNISIIRMSLCGDTEDDLKPIVESMQQQTADFRTFSTIVWEMGKLDLAERYYRHLVNELQPNDPSLYSLYDGLSRIATQKGDQTAAIEWFKLAMQMKPQTVSNNDSTNEFQDCIEELKINDLGGIDSVCPDGSECVQINDGNHSTLYQHPEFCVEKGYCQDMSQAHLIKYRHVPLCKDGLKCPLLVKNNLQHCSLNRHCKLNCQFAGFCPNFHNAEHMEDEFHPFNSPCPFTPYMCQFHVKSLQNKTKSDYLSSIDLHCFRYSHVCPFGQQCNLLMNKEHMRSNIHISRILCPNKDNCTLISDDDHLNSFSHKNIRDIRFLCQYPSLDCRDRSNPEHKQLYRHTGNFDHIGVVHYSGFNRKIDFVQNQIEMIEKIHIYLESANWKESTITINDDLRQWIRALQPVHRCSKDIFESILVHGHVMSRDHMNSLRQTKFVANTVKQHKKLRLIFDRIDNPVVHRNAQEYIQELVEIAFRKAGQETQTTSETTIAEPSSPLDDHSIESKLRQKEMILNRYLTNEDIEIIRICTTEIAEASLLLNSMPTGIGFEPDKALGTNKHVFGVLGPHAGYYYGDIFLVFRHELMFHPDTNFSIQAATTFGKSMNAYKFRPWLKDPGSPETRIEHFHRNKLHCSILGYEYAAANELIALTGLRNKSTVDSTLTAIQQRWMNIDSHCVFEAHLPQLIPLDNVDRVYIAKTTFNSLSPSAQQSARTIFGNGLIITSHEIDINTKPAGLHQPLDAIRTAYQSFVLAEIFTMIEAKAKSLSPICGTVITLPANKFEQHILIPITISQSYNQYRLTNKQSMTNDDTIYIYWQAMHGDMMLTITNEIINSKVNQPNLQCLICYIAEWPSNSTIENPSQIVADYREGYSYISNDQPVMHEVIIHKRQVKTSSNSFHRGCNTDDYITYCLTINRQTGQVILSHVGSNSIYNNEILIYTFNKIELDLIQLNYIQVSAGLRTVPIRNLVIRHEQIAELHQTFKDLNPTNNLISMEIGDTKSTSFYKKILETSQSSSSNSASLIPCADSVHCLLQYLKNDKGRQHNSDYSHPCRFSEVCRNKTTEPHLVHIPHLVPMCLLDKNCRQLGEPLHRAQYRHSNLPDYLVPCRLKKDCKDTTPEHRKKYSHREQIPLPT